jgi:adenylate cyclase, class 2
MIEVEAKFRVKDVSGFRRRVRALGKYVGKEEKIDDYYTLEPLGRYPKKSLRVRWRKGFCEINYKQRISYSAGVHAKKEVEFRVSDMKGFISLIKDFGYKKWLRKEKVTELYKIKEGFHVEINKVKGLGSFVEVEYLTLERGIGKARKAVQGVLKELGVSQREIIKDGYTKMLWDKKVH